jgi:hypothetical protein
MALLNNNVPTLLDHAKRLDPGGKIDLIAEMLSLTNPILQDMVYKEGNLPTGERFTARTSLPTVDFRLLNQGVTPSKSTTSQVDESCGILEAWCEVDKDIAELNGNTAAFRLSESQAFIEAMNQKMADTVFYGDQSTAPAEFTGLHSRFSAISGAVNGENIIDAGGTGTDLTSVWLVVWGLNTVYGIYPKGSRAGLFHEDLGLQTIETVAGMGATNGRMRAYQDHWQWKSGLCIRDWRYVVRLANIEAADLLSNAAGACNLRQNFARMVHRIPVFGLGRAAIYMNRTVAEAYDLQTNATVTGDPLVGAGVVMGTQTGGGQSLQSIQMAPLMSFRGIPIRVCDSITSTESEIS